MTDPKHLVPFLTGFGKWDSVLVGMIDYTSLRVWHSSQGFFLKVHELSYHSFFSRELYLKINFYEQRFPSTSILPKVPEEAEIRNLPIFCE